MRLLVCAVMGWAAVAAAKSTCAPGFEDAVGVLFDEDGRPVDEASLELFPLDDFDSFTNPRKGADESGNHYAELSPNGEWRCPCLRKGAYEVQVHAWAFAPVLARGVTGTPTRIAVRLRAAVAQGRVQAAPGIASHDIRASLSPESDQVRSVRRWPPRPRHLKIERDFSFKTPPLVDGRWLLEAYDMRGRTVRLAFEVKDQKAPTLEVVFKLAELGGLVVDSRGKPVPDAGVLATAESVFEEIARSGCGTVIGRRGFGANTDGDGKFVIRGLSAMARYRLEARGPDGESEGLKNVAPDASDLRLVTGRRSSEFGTVIVSVTGAPQPLLELRRPGWFPDSTTQEDGLVRFEDVRSGPVAIDVFAAGKAARSVDTVVEPGKERTLEPIALVDERPLTVRVRDADTGRAVEGARILLENPLWRRAQLALDDAARNGLGLAPFLAASGGALHGLSPGPVAFSLYAKGYAVARFVAAPEQAELEVRLKAYGPVTVALLSRDGGVLMSPAQLKEAGSGEPALRITGGHGELRRVDPGLHVLQSVEPQPRVFPAWFTSGVDGGAVTAYEAVGGATLRVSAYGAHEGELHFRLVSGDYTEPGRQHPFWGLEQAAIRPRWHGQSGAQFEPVRPGQYTVLVYEPERRLGQTLRYRLWRRALWLEDGMNAIELESFERRPDVLLQWPPPELVSPNPME